MRSKNEELARDTNPLLDTDPMSLEPQGFRVVVQKTVGQVRFGVGNRSAITAAFEVIGEYLSSSDDVSGEFRFPHEDGGDVVVYVSSEGR